MEETLTAADRTIFAGEGADDEMLFPELGHGESVILEGKATKGNETANTSDLRYHDHILVCTPAQGSVVRYKPALFERALVHGTINRNDEHGRPTLLKPKVVFSRIELIRGGESHGELSFGASV